MKFTALADAVAFVMQFARTPRVKANKVLKILHKVVNYKWEPTDNAHTVGATVRGWAKEIMEALK